MTDTYLYWANTGDADESNGEIVRSLPDGSERTVLAGELSYPMALALDETHVF